MNITNVLTLLLCAVVASLGQVLFQIGAMRMPADGPILLRYVNVWIAAGLALYVVETLVWIWVLRTVSVSIAFSFMALAYILIPLFSYWLLDEPIGAKTWIGSGIIIFGICLAASDLK